MICASCQTTLPEEAIACWKCGKLVVPAAVAAPVAKRPVDLLLVLITLLISVAVFVCLGWAVPFTVWGLITSSAKQYPEWSGVLGIISGGSFILSALVFFGGTWWGCYKVLERLTSPTSISSMVGGASGSRQVDDHPATTGDASLSRPSTSGSSDCETASSRGSESAWDGGADGGENKNGSEGDALDSSKIAL